MSRSHFPNNASSTAVSITAVLNESNTGRQRRQRAASGVANTPACMYAWRHSSVPTREIETGGEVGGVGGWRGGGGRIKSIVYVLKYSSFLWIFCFLFPPFSFIYFFRPYTDWCGTSGPRRSTTRPTNHSFCSCSWELSTAKHPLTEMKSQISQADKLWKYSLPELEWNFKSLFLSSV